ncbi:hypothetical protein BFW01_g387 [Lasiodiplodia theobromae]|uniref:Uncharacterized protein n=1 Tax=Lasiodiplodia theobromae TaxID=45133 RepID=A0A8H7IRE0_9PEZI|nr:hypothetical protein BFW01_g387 [Lasiodiplodia theobromae]
MTNTQQPTADPNGRPSSPSMRLSILRHICTIPNILAVIYILTSVAFPIILYIPVSGQITGLYEMCSADGRFDWYAESHDPGYTYYKNQAGYYYRSFLNLFSRTKLVTVTVAFGSYSFAQAKWIDLAWDIGVGRIGQFILVYISSRVITRSMLYAMKTHPIPHHLFVGISFQDHSSLMAIWSVVTVTSRYYLWKVWKGHLVVIALIMTYLLLFPTIAAAMTGYITNFSPMIQFDDAAVDYYKSDYLGLVYFTIGNCSVFGRNGRCHFAYFNDGWEIAETGDIYDVDLYYSLLDSKSRSLTPSHDSNPASITAFYCQEDPDALTTCGTLQIDNTNYTIDPLGSLDIDPYESEVYYNGTAYGLDYVMTNGQCQPGNEYRWGFSYQMLFIFSFLNLLWAISTWWLWLMAKTEHGITTDYGVHRAAVDLTSIAKATLGTDEKPVDDMSDTEIKEGLERNHTGFVRTNANSLQPSFHDYSERYQDEPEQGCWSRRRRRRT